MATGAWVFILAGFAVALAALAVWLIRRTRVTPAERERRRRFTVSARGRVGSATITDYHDGIISYTYTTGGVEHAATQDLSALLGMLPQDPVTGIAQPASLKYLLRNPANSIVLAENWSGLRFRAPSDASANHARKGAV
jgi:hypothetical protein